ncbi:MAG: transpeptidase [Rhizobium sp.]|nr:transpeptidase [Rhizobium sp.]
MKKTILALPLMAMLLAGTAIAQDQGIDPHGMVLVTPEGELLDYIPDASDVVVKRNSRGQRVLIDHFGNMIATEVRARNYLARADNRRRLPGVESFDQQDEIDSNGAGAGDPNYFPDRPQNDETETVTGSVPEMNDNSGTAQNFENQTLPSDGIRTDNMDQSQEGDIAALEPLQPAIEDKPVDPVITLDPKKSKFEITALQVFLDREAASPGVIDGRMGLNVSKAVLAYEKISGEKLDPNNSEDIMTRLGFSGGLPVMEYTISSADAAGPYVASIPEDYSQKAALPSMAYTSVTEALAERFHMDENYLKELNPGKDFTMPGTVVKVINPGLPKTAVVAKIVADKARKQLFAYGPMGELVAAFPASIGSSDTPSPSGIHVVDRVALDPNYTYNPKINFQQGGNTKVLTIPPGPNGPVGTVWIALDKPTYGIHGTPDPSRIGKTQSHGCIRLTNWDARELAKMVKPGVTVEFID